MFRYAKKRMYKKRYLEEYEEGSNLLWPGVEEDKFTRKFNRDFSHLSKKTIHNKNGCDSIQPNK